MPPKKKEKPAKFGEVRTVRAKPLVTVTARAIRKALKTSEYWEAKRLVAEVEDLAPAHEVSINADRWKRCIGEIPPVPEPKDGDDEGPEEQSDPQEPVQLSE
jgi:hypothetical protein